MIWSLARGHQDLISVQDQNGAIRNFLTPLIRSVVFILLILLVNLFIYDNIFHKTGSPVLAIWNAEHVGKLTYCTQTFKKRKIYWPVRWKNNSAQVILPTGWKHDTCKRSTHSFKHQSHKNKCRHRRTADFLKRHDFHQWYCEEPQTWINLSIIWNWSWFKSVALKSYQYRNEKKQEVFNWSNTKNNV